MQVMTWYVLGDSQLHVVSGVMCMICNVWYDSQCRYSVYICLSSLLREKESIGGSAVRQKADINSLCQAERDAVNPLCKCFTLLLWGMLWNWSVHCVNVWKWDKDTMSQIPYYVCILVWALLVSETPFYVHTAVESIACDHTELLK